MNILLQTIENEANLAEDCFFMDSEIDIFDDEMFDDIQFVEEDWEMEF
ncbi:MAG: hypothetical protein OEX19_06345 [Gammaproteobacteria bacterium]|nr:hypothetical protein [Gammaproteobacteria bacterium]